jgi:hypothetical protein
MGKSSQVSNPHNLKSSQCRASENRVCACRALWCCSPHEILRDDFYVQFSLASGPRRGPHSVSITQDRRWLSAVSTTRPNAAPQNNSKAGGRKRKGTPELELKLMQPHMAKSICCVERGIRAVEKYGGDMRNKLLNSTTELLFCDF